MGGTQIIGIIVLVGIFLIVAKFIYDIKYGVIDNFSLQGSGLSLCFQQGKPYFQQYQDYGNEFTLYFWDGIYPQFHINLALKKVNSGWMIEKPQVFPHEIGVLTQKNILQMIKRINSALQNEQEIYIGDEISNWRVKGRSSIKSCSIALIPSLENIVSFPENYVPTDIFLLYHNEQPVFVLGNRIGQGISLEIGEYWDADFQRPAVTFTIALEAKESGWCAKLVSIEVVKFAGKYGYWYHNAKIDGVVYSTAIGERIRKEQEPKVLELIDLCNEAISRREVFNFHEFENHWKNCGEYFHIYVASTDISKSSIDMIRGRSQSYFNSEVEPKVYMPIISGKSCIFVIIALGLFGFMILNPESLFYSEQLTHMPALGFLLLFIMLGIAGFISYF